MTTLTPADRERSARFQAHLLGERWRVVECKALWHNHHHIRSWELQERIEPNQFQPEESWPERDPLDPTTAPGQIAAMELLKDGGFELEYDKANFHRWRVLRDEHFEANTGDLIHGSATGIWADSPGAAITAAWMDAAEKWEATATPSDVAG